MTARTRIAVAGAGLIGKAHIDRLRASERNCLAAVVDPSPDAARLAAEHGVRWHSSLETLLREDRPDAIVLATPNQFHVDQAVLCIEAGLPVLLEKPIATQLEDGERLVRRVEALGARVLIGHHRAHSPIMQRAREIVQSGTLGRIVAAMGSAVFFKPDHYFSKFPWRTQPGGGPILINMIHEVHNLRLLCGEIVAVQAIASNAVRQFAVEDSVAINFRFASGALGSFMLSDTAASARSWEHTSQENKAYPHYDDEDCYVISGTTGTLSIPTMRLKRYRSPEGSSWWKPFDQQVVDLVRDDPLTLQMEHFGKVVRGEAEPLVSARDGCANLRVTSAIVESAASGALVHIQSS